MMEKPFHIKMLLTELQNRKQNNPSYSLRAFSRFLGVGPSTLSRILNNGQDLSLATSKNIIKKLKLNHQDCLLFIASIAEEKKIRAIKHLSSVLDDSTSDDLLRSYEWLSSSSPDLIFVLNRDGRCILTNETVAAFFNRSFHSLIGKTMPEMGLPEDISKKIRVLVDDVFKKAKKETVDECYSKDGGMRCFEIKLIPIMGQSREVHAVACHWKDISERVTLEHLLDLEKASGDVLSRTQDYEVALKSLVKVVLKNFADACVIQRSSEDQVIQGGNKSLLGEFTDMKQIRPSQITKPQFINHIDEAGLNLLSKKKVLIGSYAVLPLRVFNKDFGSISFIRQSTKRNFTKEDRSVAVNLVRRVEDCIERCVLYERCG